MGEIDHVLHRRLRARRERPARAQWYGRIAKAIPCLFAISVLVAACKPSEPAKNETPAQPDETQQRIAERRKTAEDLGTEAAALQAKLPAQADVDAVFQEVRALLDKHRLELSKREASGSTENARTYYMEVSRNAQVTGSFPNIQAFFRDVAALERPVTLTSVSIERGDEKRAALQTNFVITAYYLSDANRQPPQAAQAATPEQELAALDAQVRDLTDRIAAFKELAKAQRGPSTVLDLIVAKLPGSSQLRLDAVRLENQSLTVSGITTREDLVTEFGRALQSDTSGVLQDISFRAEPKSGTPTQPPDANANGNTNAATPEDDQELAFNVTAKYVPTKLS